MNTIEKWNEKAWALGQFTASFGLPLHVLVGEALDVVRFAQRNWEAGVSPGGQEMRPGLKTAVGAGSFGEATVTELLELIDALQKAQSNYRLLVSGSKAAPTERAQFVLSEIRATLEWCFDDGERTDEDVQLENLALAHENALSQDALAAALFDYAELAARVADKLRGLGGFELGLIEEARALGQRLREQSAGPATLVPTPAEREALELRHRLATMVSERVARVRCAARFVYRRHPELAREVGSTYARRRRAAQRKAAPPAQVAADSSADPIPG